MNEPIFKTRGIIEEAVFQTGGKMATEDLSSGKGYDAPKLSIAAGKRQLSLGVLIQAAYNRMFFTNRNKPNST